VVKATLGLLVLMTAYSVLFVQPLPVFLGTVLLVVFFSRPGRPKPGFQSLDE